MVPRLPTTSSRETPEDNKDIYSTLHPPRLGADQRNVPLVCIKALWYMYVPLLLISHISMEPEEEYNPPEGVFTVIECS